MLYNLPYFINFINNNNELEALAVVDENLTAATTEYLTAIKDKFPELMTECTHMFLTCGAHIH